MLKNLNEVRHCVAERVSSLKTQVFERPPADYAAFQQLLGRYIELRELEVELAKPLIEDDKS